MAAVTKRFGAQIKFSTLKPGAEFAFASDLKPGAEVTTTKRWKRMASMSGMVAVWPVDPSKPFLSTPWSDPQGDTLVNEVIVDSVPPRDPSL